MSEAGREVSFSLRKRIAFALGSGSGCAKGEIADLIADVIEIPLYYPALAGTDREHSAEVAFDGGPVRLFWIRASLQSHCHSSSQGGDVVVWLPSANTPKHHASPFDIPLDT